MTDWISNQLQQVTIAIDDDAATAEQLTSKMKRHRKFAAEMLPYERRVDTVVAEGDDLIYQRHPARDDISARLTKLECVWHDLIDAIRTMSNRVDEAYEAGIGDRSVGHPNGRRLVLDSCTRVILDLQTIIVGAPFLQLANSFSPTTTY